MNTEVGLIFFVGAIGLSAIGIAGLLLSNHLFRMVLALAIAEAGANLLLVMAGYRWDAAAPIVLQGQPLPPMVDPVPQAMVLTAIVIGVGVQALALSLVIRIKQRYGALDMPTVRQRLQDDLNGAAGIAPAGSRDKPAGERPLPAPGTLTPEGAAND